jgi:DinB superfamily
MPTLAERIETLEAGRLALCEKVKSGDATWQTTPPKPKEWSPVEVLGHMALVEETLLANLDTPLSAGTRPTRSLMVPMMCFIMRNHIRVPAPDTMQPPAGLSCDEAITRWAVAREKFLTQMRTVSDADMSTVAFLKHPMAGPLSLKQVLDIQISHQIYHLKGL